MEAKIKIEILKTRSNFLKNEMIKTGFSLIWGLIMIFSANAQDTNQKTQTTYNHTLTIYVIPSASPLNWESPAALYQSYKKSLIVNVLKTKRTIKGHFFIKLSSPLLNEPLYAGICCENKKEEREWVLKNKIGLGVMGVCMKGIVQGSDVLKKKLEFHSRKNNIAFLKISLSESATKRLLGFMELYNTEFMPGYSKADFYSGTFYPLYNQEGAGCSSFALAILELLEINNLDTENWKKSIKIPMNLIGGEMNNNRRVNIRDIKKTESWHQGDGIENQDFVDFDIYDPTTAYNWIINHNKAKGIDELQDWQPESESGIPGLFCNLSHIEFDSTKSILKERSQKNFFVDYHFTQLLKLIASQDTVLLTIEKTSAGF